MGAEQRNQEEHLHRAERIANGLCCMASLLQEMEEDEVYSMLVILEAALEQLTSHLRRAQEEGKIEN